MRERRAVDAPQDRRKPQDDAWFDVADTPVVDVDITDAGIVKQRRGGGSRGVELSGATTQWHVWVLREDLQELQQPDGSPTLTHRRETVQVRAVQLRVRAVEQVDASHEDTRPPRQGHLPLQVLLHAVLRAEHARETHAQVRREPQPVDVAPAPAAAATALPVKPGGGEELLGGTQPPDAATAPPATGDDPDRGRRWHRAQLHGEPQPPNATPHASPAPYVSLGEELRRHRRSEEEHGGTQPDGRPKATSPATPLNAERQPQQQQQPPEPQPADTPGAVADDNGGQ